MRTRHYLSKSHRHTFQCFIRGTSFLLCNKFTDLEDLNVNVATIHLPSREDLMLGDQKHITHALVCYPVPPRQHSKHSVLLFWQESGSIQESPAALFTFERHTLLIAILITITIVIYSALFKSQVASQRQHTNRQVVKHQQRV